MNIYINFMKNIKILWRTCSEIKHVNFHGFTIFQKNVFIGCKVYTGTIITGMVNKCERGFYTRGEQVTHKVL